MAQGRFFILLATISILATAGLFFVNRAPALQAYTDLAWISLAFFIMISILMYYAGYRAALSDNKYQFTNVIMGFTFGKMMLSALIILAYNKLMEPDSKFFILPFFGLYVIYTIFETYFLMKLGRMSP